MIFLRFLFNLKNVSNNKDYFNHQQLDVNNNNNRLPMTSSINKMMEEIRRNETTTTTTAKISKIFKQYPHHNSIMDFRGSGGSANCNNRTSGILLNMMPREEYEKEKQRWWNKLSETESELKLSEQTNASLVQAKAELLKRLKDLERVHKILQENYRKLLEKQKSIFQEAKKSEEKFKQCHEANLNLKHSVEKISQEHCKASERKLRGEKQEEVERLKQQNLHYCKLIAGLKRSEHEKDRRIDILCQKINQLKKIQSLKSTRCSCRDKNNNDKEDIVGEVSSRDSGLLTTRQSIYDADWFKQSMTSLNTIVEDCSELSREELEASYRNLLKKVNILLVQQQQQQIQQKTSRTVSDATTSPTLPCSSLPSSTFLSSSHSHEKNTCCRLGAKLMDANRKIAQLEKALEAKSSASDSLNNTADSVEWTQKKEKAKLCGLIQNLRENLDHVTSSRDKFESDLQEQKERNELLEFRLLEIENSSCSNENDDSYSDSSYCNKSVCDRSVSTNDDEGFCSADCSSDELSETGDRVQHMMTADDLMLRFTLLKHRKDLKDVDRLVIGQVKEEWERLQSQHSNCKSVQTELELKCRETESSWMLKVDKLQADLSKLEEKLANTQRKLARSKEMKKDYEHLLNRYYKLQKIQAEANESITKYKSELEKLQYILRYNRNHVPQSLHHANRSAMMCQSSTASSTTMDSTSTYRFALERAQLRSQLCQQKNYCHQLEKQFDVQLATVKVLKDELLVRTAQRNIQQGSTKCQQPSANCQQRSAGCQQLSAADVRPINNRVQRGRVNLPSSAAYRKCETTSAETSRTKAYPSTTLNKCTYRMNGSLCWERNYYNEKFHCRQALPHYFKRSLSENNVSMC